MPKSGILFAFIAMLACTGVAQAQDDIGARLSMDRIGDIQPGAYSVNDHVRFSLDRYGDRFLMRLAGEPEVYVLYDDHGSLGGRVLKYDSGATAIHVAGWGAITLYTDAQPSGLPAERSGDSTLPVLVPVSLAEMQRAAEDEAEHLGYARGLRLNFSADWPALTGDSILRALAFDALQNGARGIERFCADGAARAAFAAKIDSVYVAAGGRPQLTLRGKTLIVTFSPSGGFAGRASSRGISRGLGQLLSIATPN